MAFMITKFYTTHAVAYVQILLKLPAVYAEIRSPKPNKIKSKSCTFSVRRSFSVRFRFRFICESADRVLGILFFRFGFISVSFRFRCICEMAFKSRISYQYITFCVKYARRKIICTIHAYSSH